MTLSLGIDVGTSGVRTAVMDSDTLVSMARADHPPQDPAQMDANGWWTAVAKCLHAQVAALVDLKIDPKAISAIAVDGTSGSMVLTDADLTPTSPALMYNSKGFDNLVQSTESIETCMHRLRATVRCFHTLRVHVCVLMWDNNNSTERRLVEPSASNSL